MNGEIAFTASCKVSLNRAFSTWVNDQPAGLLEHRENKMWRDGGELERTLNHTQYLAVFVPCFQVAVLLDPVCFSTFFGSARGQRAREGNRECFLVLSQNTVHFWHPVPQSGHPANWEGFEASWWGTKQTKIVQRGKNMAKGIWKNSAESHVWWGGKKPRN